VGCQRVVVTGSHAHAIAATERSGHVGLPQLSLDLAKSDPGLSARLRPESGPGGVWRELRRDPGGTTAAVRRLLVQHGAVHAGSMLTPLFDPHLGRVLRMLGAELLPRHCRVHGHPSLGFSTLIFPAALKSTLGWMYVVNVCITVSVCHVFPYPRGGTVQCIR
jgi:hypothetical protein